jgi:NAD(P)-dependent dehydrogenase (short-subunit alcohol dehydrogenase family)
MRLKDKVAIITGAASGIGSACALRFAQEGAKVIVADIDATRGNEVITSVKRGGGEGYFIRTDVTKPGEVEKMVEKTVDRHGKLDVLFNNAGINPTGDVVTTPVDDWDRVVSVNLKGVFLGCKYAIPVMIRSGGGSILNMGSTSGLEAGPFPQAAYEATKAGVIALTKSAAQDFAAKNVRVNCICPGGTLTPMVKQILEKMDPKTRDAYIKVHPIGRLARPEEIASLAVFLASDESSFVTGAAITIDGGRTTGIRLSL